MSQWQTLACCMEIAQVVHSPTTTYISHFPVHQVSWGTLLWSMPIPAWAWPKFLQATELRDGMVSTLHWLVFLGRASLCLSSPLQGSWLPVSV